MIGFMSFQSALFGGIVSVLSMSWISLNAQWAIASGAMHFEPKITSVDSCNYSFDHTVLNVTHHYEEPT